MNMADFHSLPDELLGQIIDHLDFVSLSFLRATCHKLYNLPTTDQITSAFDDLEGPRILSEDQAGQLDNDRFLTQFPEEIAKSLASPENVCTLAGYEWLIALPCYTCRRLLPLIKFCPKHSDGERGLGKRDARTRFCDGCGWKTGMWTCTISKEPHLLQWGLSDDEFEL